MPDRAPRPLRRRGAAALAALARPLRDRVVMALAALAGAVAGCGSASVAELPPPAAPRAAPPLRAPPAGRVVPLGSAAVRGPAAAERIRVDAGAKFAVVRRRERIVELFDAETKALLARTDAGVGPVAAVANDRWLWVTDTRGDALLVFRTRPELELVRRVFLPGGPYAIALDTEKLRLWVTLTGTNEVAELPANGRPRELRRFGTVRQPNAVAVDSRTHRVRVAGEGLQLLDPPPLDQP